MKEFDVKKVEQIIDYHFRDENLLITALTHSSFVNEHDNCCSYEKLEFLGDSVLNFIIAEKLYKKAESEGEMTQKRAVMVSREPLCRSVNEMGLYEFVRFGNGTDKDEGLSVKTQSDIFESVLAAIYLDSGSIEKATAFVDKHLSVLPDAQSIDYKSRLQEYAQANKLNQTEISIIRGFMELDPATRQAIYNIFANAFNENNAAIPDDPQELEKLYPPIYENSDVG